MPETAHFIGKSIDRIGMEERLRGAPVFSADAALEDPLVLKVVRSSRAHARITGLDVETAARIPGVVGIFTARDVPGKNLTGIINKDRPLLAVDRVRCVGDPVALVAAETEAAARSAANEIRVDYENLPVVHDVDAALRSDAPRIHEKGNLLFTRTIRKGDAAAALAKCPVVATETYKTSFLEHAYIEPDAGAGFVDQDGTLVVIASTQNPHYDHSEVVSLLGVPDERVRIIQAATGGGFGSKLDLNMQGYIGLALYHLGRPVRCVYSREESFLATAKRHPLRIRLTAGADRDGRLQALRADIVCDTGAYGSYGIAVASRSAVHVTGPYEVPNVDVVCRCVYTNNPFCGAMRGFGAPQAAFAHESHLNRLAEMLNMDPLEIRRINALQPGSETATRQKLTASVGIGECLEAVKPQYEAALVQCRSQGSSLFERRGVGVGAMWYGIGNTGVQNPSTAQAALETDGSVSLYTGCADIGQGSSTVLCQIAGEVLGLEPRAIHLVTADTGRTPNAGATSASRQTYISGNAVKDAAGKLADVLLTEAVDLLKVPKDRLLLNAGRVADAGNPQHAASFGRIAARLRKKGIPTTWQGYFDPVTVPLDPETGEGVPYATYAFACHVAVVRVDVLTGEVRVEKIIAAHDVGRAVHPEAVVGQICGGAAMGLGFALMEEFTPGETESFKDYHIPTCSDMPEVIPIIVESTEPTGPFGAKGVGEPALIPTAPAILNAIADALGTRIFHLPANLERVLAASIKGGLWSGASGVVENCAERPCP